MKILIVEDDRKVARFLKRVLSEESHVPDVCASGDDALVQIRSGVYDLVILDWMIPGIDGLDVCRHVRRAGSNVPILMLTARGELSERVLALNAGADDYLVKPFEVDELLARVTALLRRAAGSAILRIGPLEIDRYEHRARVAGRTIELSTREFSLLAYLARHANEPVPRSKLMTDLWATQLDSQSNLVDVYISHLRDKLADHAWMIETIRGRGYRLRTDPPA